VTDTRDCQEKSRLGRLLGPVVILITILVGIVPHVVGLNVGYLDIAGASNLFSKPGR
jgi:hypothetical protein